MCDRKTRLQCYVPDNGCVWQGGRCKPSLLTRVLDRVPEALANLQAVRSTTIEEADATLRITVQLSRRHDQCLITLTVTCPQCKTTRKEQLVPATEAAVLRAVTAMLYTWRHLFADAATRLAAGAAVMAAVVAGRVAASKLRSNLRRRGASSPASEQRPMGSPMGASTRRMGARPVDFNSSYTTASAESQMALPLEDASNSSYLLHTSSASFPDLDDC